MPSPDTAKSIKDALAQAWSTTHSSWSVTLHVDDDFMPAAGTATLLVADDGGPATVDSAWTLRKVPRRPLIRLTAFTRNRSDARSVVDEAADWLIANHSSANIARIEDVSDPLVTRDRATGAFLASILMPVIVRPV